MRCFLPERQVRTIKVLRKHTAISTFSSCTLDASVKIYGYRVDDVHLTSYKVLHNLNRTDAGGGKKGRDADGEDGGMDDDDSDAEDGAGGRTRRQKRGGGTADTLESNLGELTYM